MGLQRAAVPGRPLPEQWHISMRVRHIEQAVRGVFALLPRHRAGLEMVATKVGRLRHLVWNGYHEEAHDELLGMHHMASEVAYLNGDRFCPVVAGNLWNCNDLRRYLASNATSLINYGERRRSTLQISTSWAEGCVGEIANARLAKKQRMRWSPKRAHRVAIVRAAVLDGRLEPIEVLTVAACPTRVFPLPRRQ